MRGASFEGRLLDDHELTARAREYGEDVLRGERWPLSAVDPALVDWETSTRMRRKHGCCAYEGDRCSVRLGEHVLERAGFEGCEGVIRHELVHAWQHQHRGARAVVGDDGARILDGGDAPLDDGSAADGSRVVAVEPGHGPSFHAWVDPLELSGRCSNPYERTREDYRYVLECPACGSWWGKHRLCESVRQAAHGGVGPAGYRYCTDCETLLYLRAGERYLDHADHGDDAIRVFAAGTDGAAGAGGDSAALPSTAVDRAAPVSRPASDD